jgi:peptidoglycan/xylan/chitin deacetylase (PgdA/CDA1 family)
MYVERRVFELQMRFLRATFDVVPLARLFELWSNGRLDPLRRYCVVTFDDGWRDNYLYAFPILRSLRLPATIFLATDRVGTAGGFWPDALAHLLKQGDVGMLRLALNGSRDGRHQRLPTSTEDRVDRVIQEWKALPEEAIHARLDEMSRHSGIALPRERVLMSWDEVTEMSRAGITFGSHSRTHRILTRLRAAEREEEISGSLSTLRMRDANHVPVFCYPNGDHDAEVRRTVEAGGYIGAVTTDAGWVEGIPHDRFALPRIGLHDDISSTLPLFTFRVAGLDRRPNRRC